jgi:hypothetical protein
MTSRWYNYTLMLSRDGQSIERAPDGWERFSELRYGQIEPMPLPSLNDMPHNIPIPAAQRMTRREVSLFGVPPIALYTPDNIMPTVEHILMVELWLVKKWVNESMKVTA